MGGFLKMRMAECRAFFKDGRLGEKGK